MQTRTHINHYKSNESGTILCFLQYMTILLTLMSLDLFYRS